MTHLDAHELGVAPPHRTGASVLPGGRRLAWAEWGPDDAPALLLCAGAGTGRRLGFGTHLLERLGVRLVSVDRPGVGSSDPLPGRSLADWPADVRALREARRLQLVGAVGFSQGAPFALALGAAGLVPAVAVVSGTDELASATLRPQLVPDVAALVEHVAADPQGAEARFAGTDAATMQRLLHDLSAPTDRATYARPAFAAALQEALEEGLGAGAAGYARDVVLTMSPWPFAAEDVTVPVDLWYGRHDSSPVHSPDLGRTLQARLPDARRHVLPDEGAAVLWTCAEQVCRTLLDRSAHPAPTAPVPRSSP